MTELSSLAPIQGVRYTGAQMRALVDAVEAAIDSVPTVVPSVTGAVGDNVTDDSAAFVAAIAQGGAVYVPPGTYYLGTTTLDLDKLTRLYGDGSGHAATQPAILRWAAGTTGIRVQAPNTSGATDYGDTYDNGGDGSIIEGLHLLGGYAGTEGECHGIHLRGRATVRNCVIDAFQGDGIHIKAATGNGNANGWLVDTVRIGSCRDGLFVEGSETNAGECRHLDASLNRRWGIYDNSFLGNSYYAYHVASSGFSAGRGVAYMGNSFTVVPGQETGAATNPPPDTARNNQWWNFAGSWEDAHYAQWTDGIVIEAAGAIRSVGVNQRGVFTGYTEGGQGACVIDSPNLVIGGVQGAAQMGSAAVLTGEQFAFRLNRALAVQAGGDEFSFGNPTGDGYMWGGFSDYIGDGGYKVSLACGNENIEFTIGGQQIYVETGPLTTWGFGRAAALPHATVHRALVVSDYATSDLNQGRRLMFGTAAPATGAFAQGDTVINKEPSAGGNLGWVCTAGGTPGTWKPVGIIDATKAASVSDPTGGGTVDTECRAQLAALIDSLQAAKLMA